VDLDGKRCRRRRGWGMLEIVGEKDFELFKIHAGQDVLQFSLHVDKKGGDDLDEIAVVAGLLLVDVVFKEEEPLLLDKRLEFLTESLEFLSRLFARLAPRRPRVHEDDLDTVEDGHEVLAVHEVVGILFGGLLGLVGGGIALVITPVGLVHFFFVPY